MTEAAGARTFATTGEAYDLFMGRFSRALAGPFADWAGVSAGQRVLDVGCGPGALTEALLDRVGPDCVIAVDPSPSFVQVCRERHPGVDVRPGRAEEIPLDDDSVDAAMLQLVLHFVSEPRTMAAELGRVVRPGGVVAACVWDFDLGMDLLRYFWDAASVVRRSVPDEAERLEFGKAGAMVRLWSEAGFSEVEESTLTVESRYAEFDELWAGFTAGVGPASAYLKELSDEDQVAIAALLHERVGAGEFVLGATARCAKGRLAP